ncbi:MAG: hypothetical protein A3E87_07745 [Gammaproteobacteria bacterium RIFCSPHIGHO2_12_FULL_35_23]|nr:MAG: hypothetical protein A3E87_07745 [Gammaproteobacteria bacterium RIFCSPHIGHO2_12_FULL_35_23]
MLQDAKEGEVLRWQYRFGSGGRAPTSATPSANPRTTGATRSVMFFRPLLVEAVDKAKGNSKTVQFRLGPGKCS